MTTVNNNEDDNCCVIRNLVLLTFYMVKENVGDLKNVRIIVSQIYEVLRISSVNEGENLFPRR